MATQRYAKSYFKDPSKLTTLLGKYKDYIADEFEAFCEEKSIGSDDVVALAGVGTLFGFLKVKGVVDRRASRGFW